MWRNAGAKFVNQETGIVIELSKTGITKTVRVAEPLLRIHFALPYILQRGHLLKREVPRPGSEQSLREMLYFTTEVVLDGTSYRVIALVKHQANGHYYYSLANM